MRWVESQVVLDTCSDHQANERAQKSILCFLKTQKSAKWTQHHNSGNDDPDPLNPIGELIKQKGNTDQKGDLVDAGFGRYALHGLYPSASCNMAS